MSTSDRDETTLPGGWPDAATLQRIANEYLAAAPGAASPVTPGGLPSAPGGSLSATTGPIARDAVSNDLVADLPLTSATPANIELPGEAELREVLQGLARADAVATLASLSSVATQPSFYFLHGAQAGPADQFAPGLWRSADAPRADVQAAGYDGKSARGDAATATWPAVESRDARTDLRRRHLPFDVDLVRRDFPILEERVNGRRLVWLDNAATTQKPRAVIDRVTYFYEHENSNVHRAAHELAARATDALEAARDKVRGFLNASSPREIVFLRGATEAINLIAQSWGRQHVRKDDEIVVSWLEHHANIVPWQQLANETGARLRVIPVDNDGQILLDDYGRLLGGKTRIVSFAHVSNALGTITPAKQMIEMAHRAGAKVVLDGAQAVSHTRVDVQDLNPDWYVFSGHKVFAPTGIGALYGKETLLNETQPWQGGGSMIKDVTFERTVYQNAPSRFEAGTGSIADAVGLGAAIDYVTRIGLEIIEQYEHDLLAYATMLLNGIPGLKIIGTARQKAGVLSFVLDGHKPEEIGETLNREGIAVRAGHHCAQPILRRFGVETTVRASLAFYNTCADIDALIAVLRRVASSRS